MCRSLFGILFPRAIGLLTFHCNLLAVKDLTLAFALIKAYLRYQRLSF